jgi:hypothetical protein
MVVWPIDTIAIIEAVLERDGNQQGRALIKPENTHLPHPLPPYAHAHWLVWQ